MASSSRPWRPERCSATWGGARPWSTRPLLAALASGHLGGAALDVFNDEPLPADHPYWRQPGLQVSAHCSSSPAASITRVHELFRDNVRRFLDGRPLRNEVDLDRGY